MAIGKASDFKIYNDQVEGAFIETLVQETNAFNAASRNSIRMAVQRSRGDYRYENFFKNIADLVTRRDTTSVSVAGDNELTQEEFISVKLNRKIGPVAQTLDSFRKQMRQADEGALSFLIGTMVAKAVSVNWLNSGILACSRALDNQAANKHTIATNGTMTTAGLVDGLAKFGDAAQRVRAFVMHSKPYFDLVKSQIQDSVHGSEIAGVVVREGSPVTLNRPVIVTDSPALALVSGPSSAPITDYLTLGLVENAVVLEDSEEEMIHADIITGLENLVVRLQGEFAFNAGVKGFKWNVGVGGANPTDATLGTGTNWTKVLADPKDLAGIVVQSR